MAVRTPTRASAASSRTCLRPRAVTASGKRAMPSTTSEADLTSTQVVRPSRCVSRKSAREWGVAAGPAINAGGRKTSRRTSHSEDEAAIVGKKSAASPSPKSALGTRVSRLMSCPFSGCSTKRKSHAVVRGSAPARRGAAGLKCTRTPGMSNSARRPGSAQWATTLSPEPKRAWTRYRLGRPTNVAGWVRKSKRMGAL